MDNRIQCSNTSSLTSVAMALAFTLASFFVATSYAHSANGAAIGQKNFPVVELDGPVNGNAAVNALGGKLPDLARHYGLVRCLGGTDYTRQH